MEWRLGKLENRYKFHGNVANILYTERKGKLQLSFEEPCSLSSDCVFCVCVGGYA